MNDYDLDNVPEHDAALVRLARFQRPHAARLVMDMPNEVLTVSDPFIIEAAWGPRVVTSRTRGMALEAYPKTITAHKRLWLSWLLVRPDDRTKIVIAKKKAQARINAALGKRSSDPEDQTQEPAGKITDEELSELLAERQDLRAARNFEAADKIRDYLIAHGALVADSKIAPT
jgi:hypothetical protein